MITYEALAVLTHNYGGTFKAAFPQLNKELLLRAAESIIEGDPTLYQCEDEQTNTIISSIFHNIGVERLVMESKSNIWANEIDRALKEASMSEHDFLDVLHRYLTDGDSYIHPNTTIHAYCSHLVGLHGDKIANELSINDDYNLEQKLA